EFIRRVDPTVSLLTHMSRRKIGDCETSLLEAWLLATGWARDRGYWRRPGEPKFADFDFASAIRENAECVAACLLRAHGWHAPHAFGVSCGPNLCRAPGTWRGSNAGGCSALHGTGGR